MESKPLISVVITGHGDGRSPDLELILQSLYNQKEYGAGKHSVTGDPVYFVPIGEIDLDPLEIIISWDGVHYLLAHASKDLEILKFIQNPKEGGIGHHTREPGIEAATGEWIVLTNMDNYFIPGWYSALTEEIESQTTDEHIGAIYWNGVNNLWQWSSGSGPNTGSILKRGHIDLSFFAVRTEIAKEVGFPFRDYEGDWKYIKECLLKVHSLRYSVRKIDQTLSVHN